MAITKIIKIKGNVSSCLDYITNKDKTSEQTYVTYDGCSKNTVSYIFDQTNSINPHLMPFLTYQIKTISEKAPSERILSFRKVP